MGPRALDAALGFALRARHALWVVALIADDTPLEKWNDLASLIFDDGRDPNWRSRPSVLDTLLGLIDGVMVPDKDGQKEAKKKREEAAKKNLSKQYSGPAGYKEVGCGTVTLYGEQQKEDKAPPRLKSWSPCCPHDIADLMDHRLIPVRGEASWPRGVLWPVSP